MVNYTSKPSWLLKTTGYGSTYAKITRRDVKVVNVGMSNKNSCKNPREGECLFVPNQRPKNAAEPTPRSAATTPPLMVLPAPLGELLEGAGAGADPAEPELLPDVVDAPLGAAAEPLVGVAVVPGAEAVVEAPSPVVDALPPPSAIALALNAAAVCSPVAGGFTERTMPEVQSLPTEEKNQMGFESLTMRSKVSPVFEFSEPVDCTPVSNPPDFGVHGFSKVDSVALCCTEGGFLMYSGKE